MAVYRVTRRGHIHRCSPWPWDDDEIDKAELDALLSDWATLHIGGRPTETRHAKPEYL